MNKLHIFIPTTAFLMTANLQLNAQCDTNCVATGNELILNGDFSGGNTDFTSQYVYCNTQNCLSAETHYGVGSSPVFFNANFSGFDHTSGSGNMMIVNASTSAADIIWTETVNVAPNTCYTFSMWAASMYPVSVASLNVDINSHPVLSAFSAPSSVNTWSQATFKWFSGSSTTAQIAVRDSNIAGYGNDFAIDDISFRSCWTAGLGEHVANDRIALYPNPAGDFLMLHLSTPLAQPAELSISTTTGRRIRSIEIKAADTRIDISTLPSGTYVLTWAEALPGLRPGLFVVL